MHIVESSHYSRHDLLDLIDSKSLVLIDPLDESPSLQMFGNNIDCRVGFIHAVYFQYITMFHNSQQRYFIGDTALAFCLALQVALEEDLGREDALVGNALNFVDC
jgi:hypothetical protein